MERNILLRVTDDVEIYETYKSINFDVLNELYTEALYELPDEKFLIYYERLILKKTYREIAEPRGVSVAYAQQIVSWCRRRIWWNMKHSYERRKKKVEKKPVEYDPSLLENYQLSVRAINCLKSENIFTVGDLKAVFYDDANRLLKIRNLGSKTYEEICAFLE